jgi:hypothetical protein
MNKVGFSNLKRKIKSGATTVINMSLVFSCNIPKLCIYMLNALDLIFVEI